MRNYKTILILSIILLMFFGCSFIVSENKYSLGPELIKFDDKHFQYYGFKTRELKGEYKFIDKSTIVLKGEYTPNSINMTVTEGNIESSYKIFNFSNPFEFEEKDFEIWLVVNNYSDSFLLDKGFTKYNINFKDPIEKFHVYVVPPFHFSNPKSRLKSIEYQVKNLNSNNFTVSTFFENFYWSVYPIESDTIKIFNNNKIYWVKRGLFLKKKVSPIERKISY